MKITINQNLIDVKDIKTDSRKVEAGDLFIAYKGVAVDGHDYISQAIENGAMVIVGEKSSDEMAIPKDVQYYQVPDGREFWAEAEAEKNGHPEKKLKIIGITGTDGKTTTVNFIYHILKHASYRVGMISTVSAVYGDQDKATGTGFHVTSADPDVLYSFLKKMVDAGIEYVALEVTSHGLVHKRVYGIQFIASGITNVTSEHLIEHGTYEQLVRDKARIFDVSDKVFLNTGGKGIEKIREYLPTTLKSADTSMASFEKYKVDDSFNLKFPGDYNKQNAALAGGVCEFIGVSSEQIGKGLSETPAPPGRFQYIENKLGINIVIDFAHTENSMRNVIQAVKDMRSEGQRIIVVFGCASERDDDKRPHMGKTSSELADVVVVTSEDPRNEDPNKIIDEVVVGNPEYPFIREPDRAKGIERGIKEAKKGDWVLILGKGHEETMNIGGVEIAWLDEGVVKNALKTLTM